jgi:hypothetical protein
LAEEIKLEGFREFIHDFKDLLQDFRERRHFENEALHEIRRMREAVEALNPHGKMKLQFGAPTDSLSPNSQTREEANIMSPAKETDTQTIPCTEVETDAAGNPVTLNPANVTWSIDDPTIATLTQNADGSATFKAVKAVPPAVNPRTANVKCTDTVTGAVGTDTLEVDDSATQPGKMTLVFGSAA